MVNLSFIFFHSIFVSILLAGLSWMTYRRLKSRELLKLAELWASMGFMAIVSYFASQGGGEMMALSMLGWVWPTKTCIQLLEEMSGAKMNFHFCVIVLCLGGLVSLVMRAYSVPFHIYTAPFSISYGVVGFYGLRRVYVNHAKKINQLAHVTFILLGVFFLGRATWFLWRTNDYLAIGVVAHLLSLVGLAASTLAYYIEEIKFKHEQELMKVINERNQQLFSQSKYSELGMMAAGIAHEINNPLAIIQGKASLLIRLNKDPANSRKVTEGLDQILFTSDRIARIVRCIRDFIYQDDKIAEEKISIKGLVDDVMAFCGQRMKNHGVNLRFYGLENHYIWGNRVQLEQVIINLLNNSFDAIEFLPDKWIEISVHETAHTIQFYLKDSGPGIPPEVASHMMDPFYTTKGPGKGTGLGLALARGIVERHGGSLAYIGNTTHTTFMLELPKERSQIPLAPGDQPLSSQMH